MSKANKKQEWPNVDFFTWKYEKQTEMKHLVLFHYIKPWAEIRSSGYKCLNYIDGFGGAGAYHTEEDLKAGIYRSNNYGSPIFSIKAILKQQKNGRIKKPNIIIIDTDKKNLDNIQKILKYEKIKFKPEYKEGDFDKMVNDIIDDVEKEKGDLFPTFFLVDPFGFKIKMSTMERILKLKNTEVVVNFMYNAIQRFCNIKGLETTCNELFGCEDWKKFIDKHTHEKEIELVKIFRNQCKKFTKFVYPFKLNFPDKDMPYYYLFHLCNHYKGCVVMKDVFAKRNGGGFEYKGKKVQQTLFDSLPSHKSGNLCHKCFLEITGNDNTCNDCFIKKFSNQKLIFLDIIKEMIDVVPFTEQGIKTILQDLESNDRITVVPGSHRKGERRKGFVDDDIICF